MRYFGHGGSASSRQVRAGQGPHAYTSRPLNHEEGRGYLEATSDQALIAVGHRAPLRFSPSD